MVSAASIVVPIGICVVLPVLIVGIVAYANICRDKNRAMVLIEAIKADGAVDTDTLSKALAKPQKSVREQNNVRLLRGSIFSLVGLVVSVTVVLCGLFKVFDDIESFVVLLVLGLIVLSIGAGNLIVYFVADKQLKNKVTEESEEEE